MICCFVPAYYGTWRTAEKARQRERISLASGGCPNGSSGGTGWQDRWSREDHYSPEEAAHQQRWPLAKGQ